MLPPPCATPTLPQPNIMTNAAPAARLVQSVWSREPVRERLRLLRIARLSLADEAEELAESVAKIRGVSLAEVLASEILPFLAACRFLERRAVKILRPQRFGSRGRPKFLGPARSIVERQPRGTVLILAPSNYPLFLAGVQAIQALIAGNAVLFKPAPGCSEPAQKLANHLEAAGFPRHLFGLLPEEPSHGIAALESGEIDKVVLTGGVETGRKILESCASRLIPATMELSGLDAMLVREDADPERVANALRFGLGANGGRTCIAPRRIFLHEGAYHAVRDFCRKTWIDRDLPGNSPAASLVRSAIEAGAEPFAGETDADDLTSPLILENVPPDSPLWSEDHFSPVAALTTVKSDEEALDRIAECGFALAASIFTADLDAAMRLQRQIPAGVVTINDLIAPTADPRLPFGGRQLSGFGVTRGIDGLLEMTTPRVVIRRGQKSWAPHFEPEHPDDSRLFLSFIRISHSRGINARLRAMRDAVQLLARRN